MVILLRIVVIAVSACFIFPFFYKWYVRYIHENHQRDEEKEQRKYAEKQKHLIAEFHENETNKAAYREKLSNLPEAPPPPPPIQ